MRWSYIVAFQEWDTEFIAQDIADGALAAACWAGDYPDVLHVGWVGWVLLQYGGGGSIGEIGHDARLVYLGRLRTFSCGKHVAKRLEIWVWRLGGFQGYGLEPDDAGDT